MTRTTTARLAGITYFAYLAAGIGSMALAGRANAIGVTSLLTSFCALVLGVTLYAITREQDPELALLAMTCRIVEAIPGVEGTAFFAVGNTLFCWLLLRGRMIPVALAWLGVLSSAFLVVLLFLQQGGLFGGPMSWESPVTWVVWLPTLIFELTFAVWLLVKGVAAPAPRQRL